MNLLLLLTLALGVNSLGDTNDELVAVIQIFRHGQRTPLKFPPNDPYQDAKYWPTELGQLTNEGKQQHYDLGIFTRNRYKNFLPTLYDKKDFHAYTTDVDRTHMSAQCNLAGLYQPTENQIWNANLSWQPIPVHPPIENTISFNCPAREPLISHVEVKEAFYKDLNTKYGSYYKHISEKSGKKISTVSGVGSLYDTLFIEELNGHDISKWSSYYPEPMKQLAGYGFLALTYTEKLKKLGAGHFIHYLIHHFDSMVKNPTGHKFRMYSAHDTNIASILNTIGAFEPHSPAFASTVYFELKKNNTGHFVNIWHKNGDNFKQITVKGCDMDCPLTTFKHILSAYNIDSQEIERLCQKSDDAVETHKEVEDFLKHRQ